MRTPPLPPHWSYKAPFVKDDEGTERYALDASGRLDRLKVALILENHGYTEHAKAWRTDAKTRDALAELLAASSELLDILRDMPKGPQHEAMIKLCHAIAKAKGEEVPA